MHQKTSIQLRILAKNPLINRQIRSSIRLIVACKKRIVYFGAIGIMRYLERQSSYILDFARRTAN